MKTVFSNHNEVAHIWASQSQYEGRASNVFFEGETIYSYGRHFPVARFAPEFGNVVLFTDKGYSNSTAKHKSIIRSAIPSSFNVIYCDDPSRSVDHNLGIWERVVKRLRAEFDSKTHKITRGNLAVDIFRACEAAIVYSMAVKVSAPDWTNETNDEMSARDYVYELAKAREAKREAKQAEAKRLAAIKAAERLPMWENGEAVPLDGFYLLDTALRVKGDNIETSRGARIPVSDAIKIWPLLYRAHRTSTPLDMGLRSIQLGSYRFNSFDGHTLIVGCHTITWPQLEKMAAKLNLINEVK
jgi:hypothetical protein